MSRVLVIHDEPEVAELITVNLRHGGHVTRIVASPEQARRAVDETRPDLVVFGWRVPGPTGLPLIKAWRDNFRTADLPIIALIHGAQEHDCVESLDGGVDDCVVSPFLTRELMARIRALLRRSAPETIGREVTFGALRLDPATKLVTMGHGHDARAIRFNPKEFRLLQYLMNHPERVHTRPQLLDRVWGERAYVQDRTVDAYIKRLRKALGPLGALMIQSVSGTGYRLTQHAPGLPRVTENVDTPATFTRTISWSSYTMGSTA